MSRRLCLALLVMFALAADGQADDVYTITATSKLVEGGQRAVYFGGTAKLPDGTWINVFLRFKGAFVGATRAKVGAKTLQEYKQAVAAMGADTFADFNFGGTLGPFQGMALGEYEMVFSAEVDGVKKQTSYQLVVGTVKETLASEAAEGKVLAGQLDQLEELHQELDKLVETYGSGDWNEARAKEFDLAAEAIKRKLRKISTVALVRRKNVLTPTYPFVAMVLSQMPLKVQDLVNAKRDVLAGKKRVGIEGEIQRIESEVRSHVEQARRKLKTRGDVDASAFYDDVNKLKHWLAEVRRQAKRQQGSRFKVDVWNGYAKQAHAAVDFMARKGDRYSAGELAKASGDAIPAFLAALADAKALVGVRSHQLYERKKVAKAKRLDLPADLPEGVENVEALEARIEATLTKISAAASAERDQMQLQLIAAFATLMAEARAIRKAAEAWESSKDGAAVTQATNAVTRKMQDRRYNDLEPSARYFPMSVSLLRGVRTNLVQLARNLSDLAEKGPEGSEKDRGVEMKFNRRERLQQITGAVIMLGADLYLKTDLNAKDIEDPGRDKIKRELRALADWYENLGAGQLNVYARRLLKQIK